MKEQQVNGMAKGSSRPTNAGGYPRHVSEGFVSEDTQSAPKERARQHRKGRWRSSILGLIWWRIKHAFVLAVVTIAILAVGLAAIVFVAYRIRSGGL